MTNDEHAVEARGITKRFPGRPRWLRRRPEHEPKTAVEDVDLTIAPEEVFGLVGPNGAGKTTLIKVLTTLIVPTSGRAFVGGYDTVREERRVRALAGLVTSNERSFYWRLSGRENLLFFSSLYDLAGREARRRVDGLLDLLGLAEHADKRFDRYSTGMRQRLAIARGLLANPRFLFMDEPTKGVDPIARAELERVIRDAVVGQWRPTILITSHNLDEIERLCARVAIMNRGRIVSVGTVEELRRRAADHDRYRLEVGRVEGGRLELMATDCAAISPIGVAQRNGAVELSAGFARDSDGFPRLMRAIIENGGEVLACTRVRPSFDDVFHRLIDESEASR